MFRKILCMHDIDSLVIKFDPGELILLNICLGLMMFGIALDLHIKDFKYILKNPKVVVIGLCSQLILLPILTLIIISLVKLPNSMYLGMLMVAACPGGNISNYMVYRSKGNTALSITLTSIVTLCAVFITPLSFYLWTSLWSIPDTLHQQISIDFWEMLKIIVQLVVIPLCIGMVIHHQFPKIKNAIGQPMRWFSLLLLLGIIVFAMIGNIGIIKTHLKYVFFLVLIHNGLAYLLGYSFAKANKLPEGDARAIAIETGIQNSGLGLILIFNFFSSLGGMALVAAWWGVWDIISGFLLSTFWNWKTKPNNNPFPKGNPSTNMIE